MIGVKGTTSQGDCYYFDVFEVGRLWQTDVESSIWQTTLQYPVRVIGKSGKTWILDPSPSDSMLFCQLWVLKKKNHSSMDEIEGEEEEEEIHHKRSRKTLNECLSQYFF